MDYLPTLEKYLTGTVPNIKAPITIKVSLILRLGLGLIPQQFGFGQSNPTFCITDANGKRHVIRRKPLGKGFNPTAHRIDREFNVLDKLHRHSNVPVPRVISYCRDETVFGAEFYVMQFLDGRIFTDNALPDLSASDRRQAWFSMGRVLAALHSQQPADLTLSKFGKGSGFFPRQVETFKRIHDSQAAVMSKEGKAVGPIKGMDELYAYMKKAKMPSERTCIVHGDFKPDNLVFDKKSSDVIGILDWELSTIGHPLSDFVNWTQFHYIEAKGTLPGLLDDGRLPDGVPSVEDLAKVYCDEIQRLGNGGYTYDELIQDIPFGRIFFNMKMACISHGIEARDATGVASNSRAYIYTKVKDECMQVALGLIKTRLAGSADSSRL